MKQHFLLVLLVVFAFGCKKDKGDDVTVQNWKRELYRAAIKKDGPAVFNSSDESVGINGVYVRTDYVLMTARQKNAQQDSIYNASGRMFIYKYEKVKN